MTAILCSFSGGIGCMDPRDQRDSMKVLAVLKESPRFSVWDACERPCIGESLEDLTARGLIEYVKPGPEFPWSEVRVTDAGLKALAVHQEATN